MSDFDPQTPPEPPTPPLPYGAQQPGGNGIAVAALVLGIISIPTICWAYVSVPCAILAIVFGAVGRSAARKGAPRGGMATAGLVCGLVSILLCVIVIAGVLTCLGIAGVTLHEAAEQAQQLAEQMAAEAERMAESMPASAPAPP